MKDNVTFWFYKTSSLIKQTVFFVKKAETMNCDEVKTKFSLLVSGGLSPDEENSVREHIVTCQLCNEELQKLESAIKKFCEDAISAGAGEFDAKLRQNVHRVMIRERRRKFLQTLSRVAAVLLIGLVLFMVVMNGWLGGAGISICKCHSWTASRIVAFLLPDIEYPIVRYKNVFAFRTEGSNIFVVAFEKGTGKLLWRSQFAVFPDIITANNKMVFVCRKGDSVSEPIITALDSRTGNILWENSSLKDKMRRNTRLQTIQDNGLMYISGRHIYYIEADSGRYIWRATPSNSDITSVVESNDKKLYVASSDAICAISSETGITIWKEPFTANQSYLPSWTLCEVSGNNLVIAQRMLNSGSISCHDINTGKLVWEITIDSSPRSMKSHDNLLFVRTSSLQAIDIRNGITLWNISLEGCSPPGLLDNTMLVVGGKNHNVIVAIDAITGAIQWQKELASSCSGVTISGKMVFVSGHDYTLRAMRLSDLEGRIKNS